MPPPLDSLPLAELMKFPSERHSSAVDQLVSKSQYNVGNPSLGPKSSPGITLLEATLSGKQFFRNFLSQLSCYDMMPLSGKIVVFDSTLLVKKAFTALLLHNIRYLAHYFPSNWSFFFPYPLSQSLHRSSLNDLQ